MLESIRLNIEKLVALYEGQKAECDKLLQDWKDR